MCGSCVCVFFFSGSLSNCALCAPTNRTMGCHNEEPKLQTSWYVNKQLNVSSVTIIFNHDWFLKLPHQNKVTQEESQNVWVESRASNHTEDNQTNVMVINQPPFNRELNVTVIVFRWHVLCTYTVLQCCNNFHHLRRSTLLCQATFKPLQTTPTSLLTMCKNRKQDTAVLQAVWQCCDCIKWWSKATTPAWTTHR